MNHMIHLLSNKAGRRLNMDQMVKFEQCYCCDRLNGPEDLSIISAFF